MVWRRLGWTETRPLLVPEQSSDTVSTTSSEAGHFGKASKGECDTRRVRLLTPSLKVRQISPNRRSTVTTSKIEGRVRHRKLFLFLSAPRLVLNV